MDYRKIGGVIALILFGVIIGWFLKTVGVATATVKWKISGQELEIDLKKDLSSADVLLKKIFSEEFSRLGTIGLLKAKYGIFPHDDEQLVDKICALPVDHPVSRKLQWLHEKRKGPFAYQVATVSIGFPGGGYALEEGVANVCANGEYRNRRIQISDLDCRAQIVVEAEGIYGCQDSLKTPDIQLSHEDGKKLFGVLQQREEGIAIILD